MVFVLVRIVRLASARFSLLKPFHPLPCSVKALWLRACGMSGAEIPTIARCTVQASRDNRPLHSTSIPGCVRCATSASR
jgi:hypothetical protein